MRHAPMYPVAARWSKTATVSGAFSMVACVGVRCVRLPLQHMQVSQSIPEINAAPQYRSSGRTTTLY